MSVFKTFEFWRWVLGMTVGGVVIYTTARADIAAAKMDIKELKEATRVIAVHDTRLAVLENRIGNIEKSTDKTEAGVNELLRRARESSWHQR